MKKIKIIGSGVVVSTILRLLESENIIVTDTDPDAIINVSRESDLESINIPVLDIGDRHRYMDGWEYGIWDNARGKAKVANPGCFATTMIYGLTPVIQSGHIDSSSLYIDGVCGRSIGGTRMIESPDNDVKTASISSNYYQLREVKLTTNFTGKLWFKPKIAMSLSSGIQISFVVPDCDVDDLYQVYIEYYIGHDDVDITVSNTTFGIGSIINHPGVKIHLVQDLDDVFVYVLIDNLLKGSALTAIRNIKLMLE